jgi:hypothetical protein
MAQTGGWMKRIKRLSAALLFAAVNWPAASATSLAGITVPQSADEKKLLADFSCLDERECYGPRKFGKHIFAKFPDIAKVRFATPKDVADDPEVKAQMQNDFRIGLYFAKQITLANGQTLFDLLTKCSRRVSPLNWAQVASDPKTRELYFHMQYFPVLKQKGSDGEFEINLLFKRIGDRIEAQSPYFSTNALIHPDFLDRHGLECWRQK